jgi:hypothetical protein
LPFFAFVVGKCINRKGKKSKVHLFFCEFFFVFFIKFLAYKQLFAHPNSLFAVLNSCLNSPKQPAARTLLALLTTKKSKSLKM